MSTTISFRKPKLDRRPALGHSARTAYPVNYRGNSWHWLERKDPVSPPKLCTKENRTGGWRLKADRSRNVAVAYGGENWSILDLFEQLQEAGDDFC